MNTFDLMLLSVPAALTVAKFAILALVVVVAARGLLRPYGQASEFRAVAIPPHRRNSH